MDMTTTRYEVVDGILWRECRECRGGVVEHHECSCFGLGGCLCGALERCRACEDGVVKCYCANCGEVACGWLAGTPACSECRAAVYGRGPEALTIECPIIGTAEAAANLDRGVRL